MSIDQTVVLDESATDDPVVSFVTEKIHAFRTHTGAPGVAVALYHQGKGYHLHYGTLELPEGSAKITPTSMFALGSVTKVFTATLLASSVVGNRIASLYDSVLPYLPSDVTNPNLKPVTLVSLATHTSELQDTQFTGAGHISDQLFEGAPPSTALVDAWNAWANGCDAAIGTNWKYSNVGFVTLGFAVVGPDGPPNGSSYAELLAANITGSTALDMPLTMPGAQITAADTVAQGYRKNKDGEIVKVNSHASDLYSTSGDMLTWLMANLGVLDSVPVELASALAMTQGDPNNGDVPYFSGMTNVDCAGAPDALSFDMGLAWQITHKAPQVWYKDGATSRGGGTSWIGFIPGDPPSQGSGIAMLVNLDGASPGHTAQDILRNLPA